MEESKNNFERLREPIERFLSILNDPIRANDIAIQEVGRAITYEELYCKVNQIRHWFLSKGLNPGDRILVSLPNCSEFIYCYLACMLSGYIIVPVNSALPEDDFAYIFDICEPSIVIKEVNHIPFDTLEPCDLATKVSEGELIFFTSGTTSLPKGVCHSANMLFANALEFNNHSGNIGLLKMLHVFSLGYMAGFLNTVLCPLWTGGVVILAPQFNAQTAINFWQYAIDYSANSVWLSPTMVAALTKLNRGEENPKWARSNLKYVYVGTAPLPLSIKENFELTFGVECLESYGMSEVMFVSGNTPKKTRVPVSVGPLLENVKVEVRDDSGSLLTGGKVGQLYVNSEYVLKGYIDPDSGVAVSPLKNGWMPTGDVGYLDSEKNLFICDRIKDLIIHGGVNVSPRAVEEILIKHPLVEEVAVVGKPHPFWGEEVVAFIRSSHVEPSERVLKKYCEKMLIADARPSILKFVDSFPKSSTSKIKRNKLIETL